MTFHDLEERFSR